MAQHRPCDGSLPPHVDTVAQWEGADRGWHRRRGVPFGTPVRPSGGGSTKYASSRSPDRRSRCTCRPSVDGWDGHVPACCPPAIEEVASAWRAGGVDHVKDEVTGL